MGGSDLHGTFYCTPDLGQILHYKPALDQIYDLNYFYFIGHYNSSDK